MSICRSKFTSYRADREVNEHRIRQTHSLAGIPWFYDPEAKAYRVRAGYRFPAVTQTVGAASSVEPVAQPESELLDRIIRDGEAFQESLGQLLASLKQSRAS